MTRVFGNKDDNSFWSDKPIQLGHPKYKTNAKNENNNRCSIIADLLTDQRTE